MTLSFTRARRVPFESVFPKENGFTLIELMIVVAIIGILVELRANRCGASSTVTEFVSLDAQLRSISPAGYV